MPRAIYLERRHSLRRTQTGNARERERREGSPRRQGRPRNLDTSMTKYSLVLMMFIFI